MWIKINVVALLLLLPSTHGCVQTPHIEQPRTTTKKPVAVPACQMCTASQLQTFPSTVAGAGGYSFATQTVTLSAISIVNGCAQITTTCAAPAGDYAVIITNCYTNQEYCTTCATTLTCNDASQWVISQPQAASPCNTQPAQLITVSSVYCYLPDTGVGSAGSTAQCTAPPIDVRVAQPDYCICNVTAIPNAETEESGIVSPSIIKTCGLSALTCAGMSPVLELCADAACSDVQTSLQQSVPVTCNSDGTITAESFDGKKTFIVKGLQC